MYVDLSTLIYWLLTAVFLGLLPVIASFLFFCYKKIYKIIPWWKLLKEGELFIFSGTLSGTFVDSALTVNKSKSLTLNLKIFLAIFLIIFIIEILYVAWLTADKINNMAKKNISKKQDSERNIALTSIFFTITTIVFNGYFIYIGY